MISRPKRNVGPHIAIVSMNVCIHRVLPDGSIDPQILDCSDDFKDNEMAAKAEIRITGFDRWDCVRKIKKKLEEMSQ